MSPLFHQKEKCMSGCPPIEIEGLSPEKYDSLLKTAQAQGLNLTGPSGSTSYQGIDVTWEYDEANQALTIHCTAKPFFVPCSMIESKIREAVT